MWLRQIGHICVAVSGGHCNASASFSDGAMIDRLVHHAGVVCLKGDSYLLKDRDPGRVPTDNIE